MTDLATDLRLVHMDFRAVTDLADQVRQHPRYGELRPIADEGHDPEHPAVRLAAELEAEPEAPVGTYITAVTEALRSALAWMNGDTNA